MNPILGETYQAVGQDGTMIYMEQIMHRPPITSFQFDGPDGLWTSHGWSSWGAKAWLNSAELKVEGYKKITFYDGHEIEYTNTSD